MASVSDFPPPPSSFDPPSAAPQSGRAPAPMAPTGAPPAELSSVYYSTGIVILLSVVTLGIWTLVWSYRTGDDLKRYNGYGLGGGMMLLIAVLASPAVMFLVPSEIDDMYRRDGRQSPVGALLGLWFLLPLIGTSSGTSRCNEPSTTSGCRRALVHAEPPVQILGRVTLG